MRRISIIVFICLFAACNVSIANGYDTVKVAVGSATYLYFEEEIVRIDCPLTLPQQVYDPISESYMDISPISLSSGEKMVSLLANQKGFPTSNLLVETTANIFMFILAYDEAPRKLLFHIAPDDAQIRKGERSGLTVKDNEVENSGMTYSEDNLLSQNESYIDSGTGYVEEITDIMDESINLSKTDVASIEKECKAVRDMRATFIAGLSSQRMILAVRSVTIKDERMYFRVYIQNSSQIPYNLESIEFLIAGKNHFQRRAVQEEILSPVFVDTELQSIRNKSYNEAVFVFDQFTLDQREALFVRIMEKDGHRDLRVSISAKELLKANRREW